MKEIREISQEYQGTPKRENGKNRSYQIINSRKVLRPEGH